MKGGEKRAHDARWLSLVTSVGTFIASIPLALHFKAGTAEMQFVERAPWIPSLRVRLSA